MVRTWRRQPTTATNTTTVNYNKKETTFVVFPQETWRTCKKKRWEMEENLRNVKEYQRIGFCPSFCCSQPQNNWPLEGMDRSVQPSTCRKMTFRGEKKFIFEPLPKREGKNHRCPLRQFREWKGLNLHVHLPLLPLESVREKLPWRNFRSPSIICVAHI